MDSQKYYEQFSYLLSQISILSQFSLVLNLSRSDNYLFYATLRPFMDQE